MKHVLTLLLGMFLLQSISYGQSVPQGMKYQAAARDEKGQVMGNQFIQLKVTLYSDPATRQVEYEEIHKVMTNELGLFSLSIGEGMTSRGQFKSVPWSEKEIWMQIAVQADDETDFITISDSRMLSVPYAFHAATAAEISGLSGNRGGTGDPYIKTWSLLSNFNTVPGRDVLGTGDMADLVIVTNGKERMRVLDDGDIVVGQSMEVGKDLTVKKNVYLNAELPGNPSSASFEQGETINYGDFTVEQQSATYLTGTLTVDEHSELNQTLNVDGLTSVSNTTQSTGPDNGALTVDGGVGIAKRLNVGEAVMIGGNLNVAGATFLAGVTTITNTTQATSINNGALVVDGGVGIEKDLFVGGSANFAGETTFGGGILITDDTQSTSTTTGALVVAGGVGIGKNLNVGGNLSVRKDDTSFVAHIENLNGGSGDGLVIKLGKTHPAWDGGGYLNIPDPGVEMFDQNIGTIRGWITGEPFEYQDVLGFISPLWIAGTTCSLVETIGGELNNVMGLPVGVPPLTDAIIFDAFNSFADPLLDDDWRPDNPTTLIPGFTLEFPTNFCPDAIPSFTMPNINFVDVTNSLTQENQFLSFKDNQNRELGSIRAFSVTDWGEDFFDYQYLVNFISNTVSLDPLDIALSAVKEFSALADSYNSLGVEYASGHGDYAEWLERENPAEKISRGDIVAVKGGKITKDLTGAEQVMAVSAYPIVLGNAPEKSNTHLGNNVAFMGQIPVKVMGPVSSGDYIVADRQVAGYGIAKAQNELTLDDMPLIVGRSWEAKTGDGPKLVNTVVGVHNGDYVKILLAYEQKLNETNARLDAATKASDERMNELEARLDLLLSEVNADAGKHHTRK